MTKFFTTITVVLFVVALLLLPIGLEAISLAILSLTALTFALAILAKLTPKTR